MKNKYGKMISVPIGLRFKKIIVTKMGGNFWLCKLRFRNASVAERWIKRFDVPSDFWRWIGAR